MRLDERATEVEDKVEYSRSKGWGEAPLAWGSSQREHDKHRRLLHLPFVSFVPSATTAAEHRQQ